ncbi:30S ribosomal protein S2 [Candidatus Woesebacteria bacterium]|nr:30S ribosomal protein S2 [Candidatus Woesebacteria bacterium]
MSATKQDSIVKELFDLKAHMGHRKNRTHPKAKKNVYQMINGISVIDLTKTAQQLEDAKKYLQNAAKEGKTMLVVGTKRTAAAIVKEHATAHKLPFISNKWLPGLLTNFKTIMENVKKLSEIKKQEEEGAWNELPKHEQIEQKRIMSKLNRLYEGIEQLEKHPDILLVVDMKKEKNAVKEAQSFDIPIVAIADTNANPERIQYPIVANDDSSEVVEYVVKELLGAYAAGKK